MSPIKLIGGGIIALMCCIVFLMTYFTVDQNSMAVAAAIRAQADALKANDTLVEMEKAKHWDGKLPTSIYAGAPIPFMNMPVPK